MEKISKSSPEFQALIHDKIYHNFVEKMIDSGHRPLAEKLANEDELTNGK